MPGTLDGILITHEHSDHVQGAGVLSRKYDIPLYATRGTWEAVAGRMGRLSSSNVRELRAFEDFYIGRVSVMPFSLPHDAAEPVGYCVASGGRRVAVATDIGHLKGEWLEAVKRCDLVLLESNHDVNMLKAGRYPYELSGGSWAITATSPTRTRAAPR
jgi:phosphoribosyl 1,2-cyclic phosphodiesterase